MRMNLIPNNNNECEDDDDSDIVIDIVKEQRFDTPKRGVELKSLIRANQDAFRKNYVN